jgi:uncharacterized protein with HEPN domain
MCLTPQLSAMKNLTALSLSQMYTDNSHIGKIERYTKGLTFEGLSSNDMAADAILRNFEIIGEAAKNVPERVRRKYLFVEWKEAIGFRNVLIHDYFGIDLEAVWDTVRKNIPSLRNNIMKVLQAEQPDAQS